VCRKHRLDGSQWVDRLDEIWRRWAYVEELRMRWQRHIKLCVLRKQPDEISVTTVADMLKDDSKNLCLGRAGVDGSQRVDQFSDVEDVNVLK
jgi:hypothetical protein